MSLIRKIINTTYGLRMKIAKSTGIGVDEINNNNVVKAPASFYALKATLNSGENFLFETLRNKKVLIVNLASACGYTPQYAELEKLHRQRKDLIVLGFPANNFGDQERGSDQEIAKFCRVNYGVSFPLFKKNDVKGISQQPVYQWLTNPGLNGWNDAEPKWNFYKYLVDEEGNLQTIFSSSVSPMAVW